MAIVYHVQGSFSIGMNLSVSQCRDTCISWCEKNMVKIHAANSIPPQNLYGLLIAYKVWFAAPDVKASLSTSSSEYSCEYSSGLWERGVPVDRCTSSENIQPMDNLGKKYC